MQRLRKFFRLSLADQFFLGQVAFLLGTVRLGLSLLPFRTLRRFLRRFARLAPKQPADHTALLKVTTAVEITSRPLNDRITCLTRALVTYMLLLRRGYAVDLRIGVAHGADGRLEAHAWVEYNGQVIMGRQENMGRYVLLPAWEEIDA
jgi:hypothetical protein